jgi:mannose-6-phosphate isomerase-like protein (cupin superfamily)
MILRTVAALVALVTAVSCATRGDGKGLLPPVNPSSFTPSTYQPERPFAPQSDGALARPVFRTEGASAFRADIRDVLVPPGKTTTLAHEGIVVVDTREGTGVATVQDRPIELTAGKTFGLSQGQTARLQNNGKTPLVLRVYVVAVP